MNAEKLSYFEHLCDLLYGGAAGAESQRAGEELAAITENSSFANDIELVVRGGSEQLDISSGTHRTETRSFAWAFH